MPTSPGTFKGVKLSREKTKQERGYGGEWSRISRLKREQCPVCEQCKREPSTQVHHVTPFDGPKDPRRTDWNNLMALCAECHKGRH